MIHAQLIQRRSLYSSLCLLIVLVLIGLMVLPMSASAADPPVPYKDIPLGNSLYPVVRYLSDRNILHGYPDGAFHPELPLTRGQMAQIAATLLRQSGRLPAGGEERPFTDVPPGYWAHSAIAAMKQAGVMEGFQDGDFQPEATLTRAQAVAVMIRLEPVSPSVVPTTAIGDVPASHWASRPVQMAVAAGLFSPQGAGHAFMPDEPALRGQIAQALAKLLTVAPTLRQQPLAMKLIPQGQALLRRKGHDAAVPAQEPLTVTGGDAVEVISGEARLECEDGSSLLLTTGTKITITEARGRSYIVKGGRPSVTIDRLVLQMPVGDLFFSVAELLKASANTTAPAPTKTALRGQTYWASSRILPEMLLALDGEPNPAESAAKSDEWWRTAEQDSSRLEMNTPWGVASVQGTSGETYAMADGTGGTRCLEGSIQNVSKSGGIATVIGGQETLVPANAPPSPPAPLSPAAVASFFNQQSFFTEAANQIGQNAPEPIAPAGPLTPAPTVALPGVPPAPPGPAPQAQVIQQAIQGLSSPGTPAGPQSPGNTPGQGQGNPGGGGGTSTPDISASPVNVEAQLKDGNTEAQSTTRWTVDISGTTLKDRFSEEQISVSGLPDGFSLTARKASDKTIEFALIGQTAQPVQTALDFTVTIQKSAFNRSPKGDGLPVKLRLKPFQRVVSVRVVTGTVKIRNEDNSPDPSANQWALAIESGTLKSDLSMDDVAVEGLPEGLNWQMRQGSAGTIKITVTGEATESFYTPLSVTLTVKGSALLEPNMEDAKPVTVMIVPTVLKVGASAKTDTVYITETGKVASKRNQWIFTLDNGTVKSTLSKSDVSIDGLPAGLTATVSKGNGNELAITLSGTMAAVPTERLPVTVTVLKSAFLGKNYIDADPITVAIEPLPDRIRVNAETSMVQMAPGNLTVDKTNNRWLLAVDFGTVRSSVSNDDLDVEGLPEGLTVTAVKGSGNRIIVTVTGTLTAPIEKAQDVSIRVKGSAVQEPDMNDAEPVTVTLMPAKADKILVEVQDGQIGLAEGNQTVSSDNTWVLKVTNGTVKADLSIKDLALSGLPAGLVVTAAKGTGDEIVLTVDGTLEKALTEPAQVAVIVKASSLDPATGTDAGPVNVTILPSQSSVTVTAIDATMKFDVGNQNLSSDRQWILSISGASLKPDVSAADILFQGLPSGFIPTVRPGSADQIIIELQGAATAPQDQGAVISVTLLGSAFSKPGLPKAAPVTVTIVPSDPVPPPPPPPTTDQNAPVYTKAIISNSNQTIALAFDEPIFAVSPNTLRNAITVAEDGTNFYPLYTGDNVSVEANRLVIHFSLSRKGSFNKIKVTAGTVKDASNNVLNQEICTEAIRAYPMVRQARFEHDTGYLVLEGSDLVQLDGSHNDIDPTKLVISDDTTSYTLTGATIGAEIADSCKAIVYVDASIDREYLNNILDENVDVWSSVNPFKLTLLQGWNGEKSVIGTVPLGVVNYPQKVLTLEPHTLVEGYQAVDNGFKDIFVFDGSNRLNTGATIVSLKDNCGNTPTPTVNYHYDGETQEKKIRLQEGLVAEKSPYTVTFTTNTDTLSTQLIVEQVLIDDQVLASHYTDSSPLTLTFTIIGNSTFSPEIEEHPDEYVYIQSEPLSVQAAMISENKKKLTLLLVGDANANFDVNFSGGAWSAMSSFSKSFYVSNSPFTFDFATGKITKYSSVGGVNAIIPPRIGGVNVTAIGDNAFENTMITSVVIPSSVTTIGAQAFKRNYLTSIIIPESITLIGDMAFQDNQLTTITIGPGVSVGYNLLTGINNKFRDAYVAGGAGTYKGTQTGDWTKDEDSVPLSSLTAGSTVNFAGYSWIVLNPNTGYLLMKNAYGNDRPFSDSLKNTFDPYDPNNIAYYLNNNFYSELPSGSRALIQPHTWAIGEQENESSASIICRVGLISYDEYKNIYHSIISDLTSDVFYWTRTPVPPSLANLEPGLVRGVYSDGTLPWRYATESSTVRPALFINPCVLVVNNCVIVPANISAPAFADTYPKVGADQGSGSKQVEIRVQADAGGTVYYVVVANDAAPPTVEQVLSGKDSFGIPALDYGFLTIAENEEVGFVTRLLPADNTDYDVYVVVQNVDGNTTDPKKVDVKTPMPN
ncbi:S-layer homology domain-containing protein [Heliobacterium mobile]|uniref:S-layer homology domain-containing protein n=1 Tax=Heliobacterium mobile TaxID=28064 RepID=UPI0014785D38|nr:S-layer homology domain-containing protein [Heliobacterium mobile]